MTALYDVAAEQRLLGGLIAADPDGRWLNTIVNRIDRNAFYRGPHGDAFDAVVDVWSAGERIDLPSVAARLHARGLPEIALEAGEWMGLAGHAGSTVHDADRVKRLADRRRTAQAMWDAYEAACDESRDLAEAVDQARRMLDAPSGSEPLSIVWRDDLASLGEVSWLVEDRIAHGVSAILGKSGSHKTFLACDIACSVASGHPWFGHKVDGPAPVLYVLAEGIETARERVEAWEHDRNAGAVKLGIYPHALQLDEPRDQQRLVSTCRSVRPKLVVVDTLRRNTSGDENDSERAQALVRCLDRVREACDASSLVVHHTGATLENSHRGRGNQVLYESADTVIGVERDADTGRITLHNSPSSPVMGKQRNAREWPPLDLYPVDTPHGRVLSTSAASGGTPDVEPPYIAEPTTKTHIASEYARGDVATVDRWVKHGHLVRWRDGGPYERYVSAEVLGDVA